MDHLSERRFYLKRDRAILYSAAAAAATFPYLENYTCLSLSLWLNIKSTEPARTEREREMKIGPNTQIPANNSLDERDTATAPA